MPVGTALSPFQSEQGLCGVGCAKSLDTSVPGLVPSHWGCSAPPAPWPDQLLTAVLLAPV